MDRIQFTAQEQPCARPGTNLRLRLESIAVTKLDLFFHDTFLTSATGFLFRMGQTIALVTNWHVLSGVHPIYLGTRDERGYYPTHVKFAVGLFDNASGVVECKALSAQIASGCDSYWYQHKSTAPLIDVAYIDLAEVIDEFDAIKGHIVCIPARVLVASDGSAFDYGYPPVMSDVFILGYPRGLQLQGALPIWKRGTIASEPLFDLPRRGPLVLVDALTKDGMSGAPVLYFGDTLATMDGAPANCNSGEPWLVGIYAGREGATPQETELTLARVWRRSMLDTIFFNEFRRRGLHPKSSDWPDFKSDVETAAEQSS